MKKILALCFIAVISFATVCGAAEQDNKNPTGTIVSPELMQRYEITDGEKVTPPSPVVKQMVDSGTITTVKDAGLSDQGSASTK